MSTNLLDEMFGLPFMESEKLQDRKSTPKKLRRHEWLRTLYDDDQPRDDDAKVVGAVAGLGLAAVDHGIAEVRHMAGGLPDGCRLALDALRVAVQHVGRAVACVEPQAGQPG